MKPSEPTKKLQARSAYRQFVQDHFEQTLDRLNDRQRTEGLTRFYIDDIHSRLQSPISAEDFEIGYVDASGDLGADFIHRDDRTVLIIQSKYLAEKKAVDIKDIQHFQSLLVRLIKPEFRPNQRLAEVMSEIDFANDNFILKFVTLGDIIGQALNQTNQEPTLPSADYADRVEYQFVDASQLTDELRNAQALAGGIPGECELVAHGRRAKRSVIIDLHDAEYPSCLLVVSAEQLIRLYQQYRNRLFTLNIRNYLGNTSTNKLLAKTLRDQPEMFYYYNNGISCLAEELSIQEDRVVAKGLQIINGAQTIRSLSKAARFQDQRAGLANAKVLVRITEAPKQYGAEGRFRNEIVRFNNTQNIIKASDFRSNDPVQIDLKKHFSSYKRNGRPVQYVPKRTDPVDVRASEVIGLEEFAKVIYSFLYDPVSFSARTSYLFDDTEVGGYRNVFGDGNNVWSTVPEPDFRLLSAIWWLSAEFGVKLKADRRSTQEKYERAALERRWFVLFVSRLVLERSYAGDAYKEELRKTYRGDWELGFGPVGKWMLRLYQVSKDIVIWSYKDAARRPEFNHRNWMRDPGTVDFLKTYVGTAPVTPVKKEDS